MKTALLLLVCIATVIAALAVFGWIFYKVIKTYLKNQQKMQLLQLRIDEQRESMKVVMPIRMQAYERMVLFLDRISPDSLILRCYQPGMDVKLLQGVMTKNIRDEWEHNLSQQIYISSEAWNRIREAKEEMINTINSAAVTLDSNVEPTALAAAVFASVKDNATTHETALEFLKAEFAKRFDAAE